MSNKWSEWDLLALRSQTNFESREALIMQNFAGRRNNNQSLVYEGRTMVKRIIFYTIVLMVGIGLAGCSGLNPAAVAAPTAAPVVPIVTEGGDVVVEGNVIPRDSTRLYSRSGGEVIEVLVKEGDVVAQDAVLVRMGGRDQAEAALKAAQLEQLNAQQALDTLNEKAALQAAEAKQALDEATRALVEAQQELDDYDSATLDTNLDNAITEMNNAKDDLDDAQEEWDKNKDLDADNANRKTAETRLEDAQKKYDDAVRKRDRLQNDLDRYTSAVEAAQALKDDAQREYDARKDGQPDPDDLALAQARLANAEAQVKAAQAALNDLELKAPFGGTVVELDVVAGEILLPSQQVAYLADLSEIFIETSDLTEMDVVKVAVGQEAEITPDALTDLKLTGAVETIDQVSGKKGGDVTYTVRLKLNETDPRLRWGMTVEVRFPGE